METQYVYKAALMLHYLGFVALVGIFLASFVVHQQFWKMVRDDWQKATVLKLGTTGFRAFLGIGAALVLIGGITMAVIAHGAVKFQIWFPIKMILVIIAFANAGILGGRQERKLRRLLEGGHPDHVLRSSFPRIKKALNIFYVSQLIIFLSIFMLSAFRFV